MLYMQCGPLYGMQFFCNNILYVYEYTYLDMLFV